MKLVKFVPAIAATLVLAACSTASNVASGVTDAASSAVNATTDAVKGAANATTDAVKGAATATSDAVKGAKDAMMAKPTFETAAYFCDVQGKSKQVVSATYAFLNGKSDGATVTINTNNKKSVHELKLNANYKDGTQFVNGKKTWTLDNGFSQETAAKTNAVMFMDGDKIVAKNCVLAK